MYSFSSYAYILPQIIDNPASVIMNLLRVDLQVMIELLISKEYQLVGIPCWMQTVERDKYCVK